ncbi:MAG: penicillin acylase family protein [Candidatus Hydrogenedentes bacterium]|nr:penicillin acylase family protein [Candidatus Hydrogenedentota bacterium]
MKSLKKTSLLVLCLFIFAAGCGGPQDAEEPAESAAPDEATPASPVPQAEAAAGVPTDEELKASVTVYRDKWGVPHIYADTDVAAAYGLGYAQAEDRLADLFANVRTATGTAAEVFGSDHVESDMAMQLVQNVKFSQEHWADTPGELRALSESFIDGVEAYAAENPDEIPEWAVELEPWHCTAIGRAMIMRWPLGTVFDDLKNRQEKPAMGSNEWSVAPSRSADNCAILLADPHLTWEGMAVFYEARVHGENLHMNGFFLLGSPLMGFGHSEFAGWAPTTGGPDTSDVFEVKIDLANKLMPKYELNGEWKTASARLMVVNVKGGEPVTQPTADTELGPVVEIDEDAGIAYVGASPYFGPSNLYQQTYRMLTATTAEEFHSAIAMNEFMEQNLMYADREGNIGYVRAGKTPVRPAGYDWNAPVPATAETIWTEIHPIDDLVSIVNPPQGYMQNCNISPANMMIDSPMTPDKYPGYIYNVTWDVTNPRGKRSTALLSEDDSVTRAEAMAYTMDVYDILAEPWKSALRGAIDTAGDPYMADETFATVVNRILEWDGNFTVDSMATPIYKNWRLASNGKADVTAISEGGTLPPDAKTVLLDILKAEVESFQVAHGSVDVAWGDLYKVGRGEFLYPAPGMDFGGSTDGPNFSESLFDVRSKEDPENPGQYIAYSGSMATMLMFFHKDRIESYTCTPWGQSGDPTSPHYADQAQHLYSKRELKPTWFTREEILAHKESEKVLTIQ